MISNTSLSAFSVANGVGAARPEVGAAQRPNRRPGIEQARNQSTATTPQTLQLRPGQQPQQAAQPGQTLPRGSLLDLSV